MIKTFRNKALKAFADKGDTRKLAVQQTAKVRAILAMLDAARSPRDMDVPGLKFHSLAPGQKGRWSVWVTGNYRVTFAFDGEDAIDVDLEDYH